MPSCAIITCRIRSNVSNVLKDGISFHRFPKEPDIKEKWIDATGRDDWFPTKSSTICSKHFKDNDFIIKKSGNRYLKPGAFPSERIVNCRSLPCNQFDPLKSVTGCTVTVKRKQNELTNNTSKRIKLQQQERQCKPTSVLNSCGGTKLQKRKPGSTSDLDNGLKRMKLESPVSFAGMSSEKPIFMDESTSVLNSCGGTKVQKRKPNNCTSDLDNDSKRMKLESPVSFAGMSSEKPILMDEQTNVFSCPSSNASTPRKRKLKEIISTKQSIIERQRKQIKKIQAQNRRLKKKINKIEDVLNDIQQKFTMRDEDVYVLKNTNLKVDELMARFNLNNSVGVSKQPYSPALRTFALTLHYYSPKAYEYVRNTFNTCLPHARTLRKWYSSVDAEPGFTSESFEALKVKTETTKYPIIAGLVLDEMAIRRRIEWDGQKLHGYVEIGSGLNNDYVTEAKEALVFLVTGINCNFKVPVAYFLVDGVTGVQRAELVKQCLERIHETGVKIVSMTFDGCASNLSMLKEFGCSFDNHRMTFEHPVTKQQIVAILDPSHMIKLIRNAFQVYQTFVDGDGNKIKWYYLEKLNQVQVKEKFHLANKLRHQHIRFQNYKMKVKLATQLFSLSVADAIDFCRNDLHMPVFRESSATTKFIRIMNNLFDIFNSRSMHQYGYKKAICEQNASDIFTFLDDAVKYISTLRCQDGTLVIKCPRKVGFLGFIGCAQALRHFYTSLVETRELIFFPFYKVSQDHLELLFCNLRSHGGANNNPTARQFKAAYKKLLVHVELKDFGNGNCSALEHLSILNCSSAVRRINLTTNQPTMEEKDEADDVNEDIMPDINYTEFSTQVITHIAGHVVHVLLKKIQCDVCVGALLSNSTNSLHKFIIAKDKGGLLYPSDDVIKICKTAESIVRQHMDNLTKFTKNILVGKILKNFVGTNLFDEISFHQINEYPTSNHITDLIKAVIEKYLNVRIHYLLKNSTKDSKRQLLNKYILFQGQ